MPRNCSISTTACTLLQRTFSITQVCMLLPLMLCHLISTTISHALALRASSNRAEVNCLSSAVNRVIVADAVGVACKGPSAAGLGAWNATRGGELLGGRKGLLDCHACVHIGRETKVEVWQERSRIGLHSYGLLL
jgi:hypothetical protein